MVERADQPQVRRHVDGDDIVPLLRLEMGERRQRAEHAGIGDEDVELAPALVDRPAEPVERGIIGDVARHQRGGRAGRADRVVELLERALGPRQCDHMRAGPRQLDRHGTADAARGAGDDGDAVGERSFGHGASGRPSRPAERRPRTGRAPRQAPPRDGCG